MKCMRDGVKFFYKKDLGGIFQKGDKIYLGEKGLNLAKKYIFITKIRPNQFRGSLAQLL